jgi:hypothetical protein
MTLELNFSIITLAPGASGSIIGWTQTLDQGILKGEVSLYC